MCWRRGPSLVTPPTPTGFITGYHPPAKPSIRCLPWVCQGNEQHGVCFQIQETFRDRHRRMHATSGLFSTLTQAVSSIRRVDTGHSSAGTSAVWTRVGFWVCRLGELALVSTLTSRKRGWRGGSASKSIDLLLFQRTWFDSKDPHAGSQLLIAPVTDNLTSRDTKNTQTYMQI